MKNVRGIKAVALLWLASVTVAGGQSAERPSAPRRNSAASLDAQLAGEGGTARRPGGKSIAEWQWNYQRFVNVGPGQPPAQLDENVRVGFANRGDSYVRVTYRAQLPTGFPAGLFQGKKEVSYTMERIYQRVVIRGKKFVAEAQGPFRLVESDPPGHTLADLSTLGGIARGRNMVAVIDEAFSGENLFTLAGERLNFINQQYSNGGDARAFPAQIVMEPVK